MTTLTMVTGKSYTVTGVPDEFEWIAWGDGPKFVKTTEGVLLSERHIVAMEVD